MVLSALDSSSWESVFLIRMCTLLYSVHSECTPPVSTQQYLSEYTRRLCRNSFNMASIDLAIFLSLYK